MDEFTLDEINFLRWLLECNQADKCADELDVDIRVVLTPYQKQLLISIQRRLNGASSY